jgi:VWFA-related protein
MKAQRSVPPFQNRETHPMRESDSPCFSCISRIGHWAVAALLIGVGTISVAAQISTFSVKVKTEEVRIDVLVSDHGKPVHGLTSTDFEVFDNGVRQQIEFVTPEQMPVNAILALDMSESVAGERLAHLKSAGHALLERLKKGDRAALVTFNHEVALGSLLTADLGPVKAALDRARPSGNTSVIDASYAGLMVAESDQGRPLLIVFSDGVDTSSWLTRDAVLDTAKRGHAVVYTVSAGQLPIRAFLRDLSSFTGGSLIEVESTSNLGSVFMSILDEFRERYLVTYSPAGVPKAGWHRLEVRVKGRKLNVKARPGYLIGS